MSRDTSSGSGRLAPVIPGANPLPQVNLLPPEIRAGRKLGRLKAWLGVGILVTVLVSGLLFVGATFAVTQAAQELEEVESENQRLIAQQAEYAEVPRVLRQLDEITEGRTLGMSTEVLWRPYLAAVAATAPAGVSLDSFSASGATPTTAPSGAGHILQEPSVGTLTFSARSLTVPDVAAWLDGLETVPGFTDPWFSSAQVTEQDGAVYYTVSGTVRFTDEAYALRFEADDVEES